MPPNHTIKALKNGATVITPNNRLSEQLLGHYLQTSTHQTLPKPRCLAYPTFLRETFKQLTQSTPHQVHPKLLSDAHTQALWRNVLNQDEQLETSQNLLTAIHQASVVCENWQITEVGVRETA